MDHHESAPFMPELEAGVCDTCTSVPHNVESAPTTSSVVRRGLGNGLRAPHICGASSSASDAGPSPRRTSVTSSAIFTRASSRACLPIGVIR
jgi:hypothetical protein